MNKNRTKIWAYLFVIAILWLLFNVGNLFVDWKDTDRPKMEVFDEKIKMLSPLNFALFFLVPLLIILRFLLILFFHKRRNS